MSLALALSACGGGGSSSSAKPTPTTPTPTTPAKAEPSILQTESSISIGQATELVLFSPDYEVNNVQWTQTSGPELEFYAANSKVVGFTPEQAGSYSFDVKFSQSGAGKTLSISFDVQDTAHRLVARLGHAVVEGNGVSLIAFANKKIEDNSVTLSSLTWQQTGGPSVTLTDSDTNGKSAIFFDAPSVDKDTIVKFKVSGKANGEDVSDEVTVLIEQSSKNVPSDRTRYPFTDRVTNVFLYNADSPAGQKLIDCVYSNAASYANSCNFNQTPLIAHEVDGTPTVDQIMDRVVVSHKWMGDQFKKFLETYDNEHHDFKNLLRATTAIVLSYDVRPSFYHPYTGAIYLDPSDLWVTPAQRDTINQAPDYRAGFGSSLQFEIPSRYVKDNDYASYYFPISERLDRELSDSLYDFASLLYHELAHANDYFPSTAWNATENSNTTFLSHVNALFNNKAIQSDDLQRFTPLDPNWDSEDANDKSEMTKLGQVRFQGVTANETQKAYTMSDVANMFKVEGATAFYNYSSTREDYAMLFDGFMMKVRYNIDRDVAVSDQEYHQIAWGQRGRFGENWIRPRVEFVSNRILPEFTDATGIIANLPQPTLLDANKTWRNSIQVASQSPAKNTSVAKKLLKQAKATNSKLIPVDGRTPHTARKFIY
ncbi:hypothetical protein GCM10017161_33800 [Thalassotalea marina]|uniref:Uncharacterized protein n=2 Tax=Thalassotalea marina TaxID=1673741 RepID=A0A919BPI6_9GAMM|nr:hypothetical protein GCM10017161_33800 [Thalassotalea marina]